MGCDIVGAKEGERVGSEVIGACVGSEAVGAREGEWVGSDVTGA